MSLAAAILAMAGLGIGTSGSTPAGRWLDRAGAIFSASSSPATCAQIDTSYIQIDVPLATSGQTAGRVYSKSDGAIAVLVIVDSVTSEGAASAIDFSASVKVAAAIIQSPAGSTVRRYDPPARSASNVTAEANAAMSGLSLCYRITVPSPPVPANPKSTPTAAAQPPSPTPVEFDLGPMQTANAEAATSAALAQSTAAAAQAALAESASQVAQLQATAAAQASQIAILQSTASAPTPTATAAPEGGTVVFSASTDDQFGQLMLPGAGWRIDHGLVSDGAGNGQWVSLPAIAGLSSDQAIEMEIELGGDGACPRNFGLAVRGTDNGYVAGGLEWACDAAVKLWAGQSVIAQAAAPAMSPGKHLVRLEARGASVRLIVDGAVVLEAKTSQAAGGQLAFWSSGVAFTIDSLRVIDLS
jgi:hypothetical protein